MNDSNNLSASQPMTDPADISAYQPPAQNSQSQESVQDQPVPAPFLVPDSAPAPAPMTNPAPVAPAPTQGAALAPMASSDDEVESAPDPESLEAQNIFELLGVNDGSDQDKEAFLDELQQVIWQDFLDNDLQLLLTKDELVQVKGLQASNPDLNKQQEEIVKFLENLIPDLEEIMLEKALELKREMVKERITGMKEFLAGQADKLALIETVEASIRQSKWATATAALNKV